MLLVCLALLLSRFSIKIPLAQLCADPALFLTVTTYPAVPLFDFHLPCCAPIPLYDYHLHCCALIFLRTRKKESGQSRASKTQDNGTAEVSDREKKLLPSWVSV